MRAKINLVILCSLYMCSWACAGKLSIEKANNLHQLVALVVKENGKCNQVFTIKGKSEHLPEKNSLELLLSPKFYGDKAYFLIFVSGGGDETKSLSFSALPLEKKEGDTLMKILKMNNLTKAPRKPERGQRGVREGSEEGQ